MLSLFVVLFVLYSGNQCIWTRTSVSENSV